jgi:hypothetical protein
MSAYRKIPSIISYNPLISHKPVSQTKALALKLGLNIFSKVHKYYEPE